MEDDLPVRPDFLPPGFGTVGTDRFAEIAVPDAPAWAAETAGWYVLFSLLAIAAVAGAVLFVRRYHANAYRRAALAELARLHADAAGESRDEAVAALPALLKRCALAAFSRHEVASLSGEAWLAFLERTGPGALTDDAKATLSALVVRAPNDVPRSADASLFEGVERWMRGHRA